MTSSHQHDFDAHMQDQWDPWAPNTDADNSAKQNYWEYVGGDPTKALYPSKPRLGDHSWNDWNWEQAAQQQRQDPYTVNTNKVSTSIPGKTLAAR